MCFAHFCLLRIHDVMSELSTKKAALEAGLHQTKMQANIPLKSMDNLCFVGFHSDLHVKELELNFWS